MALNRWWESNDDEIYWMEITDRVDVGTDLNAPVADERGRDYWSYSLIAEVQHGDIVLHFWKPEEAIVGWSTATGSAWRDEVVWGAQGTSARQDHVQPYTRPGWRIGLEHFTQLQSPVTLEALRQRETDIMAIREELSAKVGASYFPFVPYKGQKLRTFQGYLVKFPVALFRVLPGLDSITRAEVAGVVPSDSKPPRVGTEYREANPSPVQLSPDPWSRDPALVDRGLRAHAAIQNDLAVYLGWRGIEPRSPRPEEPDFDIAWEADGASYVAEVKSLTERNEEKQLRLGLGQVLRYRQALSRGSAKTTAVLALEREPRDPDWLELCEGLGVLVAWPRSWGRLGV